MRCLPRRIENHVDLTESRDSSRKRQRDRKEGDNRTLVPSLGETIYKRSSPRKKRILILKGKETALRLKREKAMAEGRCTKTEEEEGQNIEEDAQSFHGVGVCKWFNVRMGFGFLSMNSREGEPLESPVDVFVHQSKLYMEGFRSLKEGEEVEFTFKKSSKGLESVRVTGPGGAHCIGSEKRPKGKSAQKRRSKGDRCYNCGGLDHHAKECKLPPQPKKCHFCQSVSHMVANCPVKAQQTSPGSQETPFSLKGEDEVQNYSPPPTEITN